MFRVMHAPKDSVCQVSNVQRNEVGKLSDQGFRHQCEQQHPRPRSAARYNPSRCFFSERDPEKLSRQRAFFKLVDAQDVEPRRQISNRFPAEKMDGKTATAFEGILSSGYTNTVLGVAGMPHRVNVEAAWCQHAPDLLRETFELRCAKRHAEEHV